MRFQSWFSGKYVSFNGAVERKLDPLYPTWILNLNFISSWNFSLGLHQHRIRRVKIARHQICRTSPTYQKNLMSLHQRALASIFHWFFLQACKIVVQFAGNARWAEPSSFRPTPLECKNEYLVLALGKEAAVQAVVGSIVWAFRLLKKPRRREMSARGYALYSVCSQFYFFPLLYLFWWPHLSQK